MREGKPGVHQGRTQHLPGVEKRSSYKNYVLYNTRAEEARIYAISKC